MLNHLNTIIASSGTAGGNPLVDAVVQVFGPFGVQLPQLFAQILNFLIVAFVLYRFAFKPVMATIEERQKKIADGLQYAEEMKRKLEETEKKYAEVLKKGTKEAQRTIDEAREHAKRLMEKHTEESISKAEDILSNARHAAAYEHEKMLSDVKKEVVELVVNTTTKVLSKELTEDQRAAFSNTAAEELNDRN